MFDKKQKRTTLVNIILFVVEDSFINLVLVKQEPLTTNIS